ncbi:MAG: 50S ribosomal protein L6 [Candidatus Sungbacteria bacterium]|nr:50S ribosomal protein L6 [Candidatus Sungbacteria bacterium]
MSRIGKKPIAVPSGVNITFTEFEVSVKGPKGELTRVFHPFMGLKSEEGFLSVIPRKESKKTSALWGLTRSLIANMISGVTSGFEKKLDFEGVGYRANVEGDTLVLQLGFSHPVRFRAPQGIKFLVEKNSITVNGIDKELVGDTAAQVRRLRPPEPYKGKGIRYRGEVIRRKAGKKAPEGTK